MGTHLWLKGGSRHQSRRRDKLRNFDWLGGGVGGGGDGGGLHLRQNHSRCGSVVPLHPHTCCFYTNTWVVATQRLLLLLLRIFFFFFSNGT